MRQWLALRCTVAMLTIGGMSAPLSAMAACDDLVGKPITLHGQVTSAMPLFLGATGYDTIVVQSTDPACGSIQTLAKLRSCHTGARFVATGHLSRGITTRSGGSDNPKAQDYSFQSDHPFGLCE